MGGFCVPLSAWMNVLKYAMKFCENLIDIPSITIIIVSDIPSITIIIVSDIPSITIIIVSEKEGRTYIYETFHVHTDTSISTTVVGARLNFELETVGKNIKLT